MRSELQAALELARSLPLTELPELLGQLEQIRVTAQMRIATPTATAKNGEVWLSADEVSARMHRSRDFVYRHAKDWPFAKRLGKGYLFSASGLDAFLKKSSR